LKFQARRAVRYTNQRAPEENESHGWSCRGHRQELRGGSLAVRHAGDRRLLGGVVRAVPRDRADHQRDRDELTAGR
jgi:hypothetical protein